MAGVAWVGNADPFELSNIYLGVEYAVLILGFLTAHEFGHYFAAKYHRVPCTLPYYIPFPITPMFPISFGTMGAVIKIRGAIPNRKALFDIGVAGPLAGFVVCYGFLVYGFMSLEGMDYLLKFHPEFDPAAPPVEGALFFGDTLLFYITKYFFVPEGAFVPPMHEIYHYPYLNVGWFGLFVTALNMLPLGQLDGGHILYAMVGKRQWKIGRAFWIFLIVIGFSSIFAFFQEALDMYYREDELSSITERLYFMLTNMRSAMPWLFMGWGGWLFWAVLARFFTGIKHPPISGGPIGGVRMFIGIITFLIFILCFSWNGIYFNL
jgi:membrane-associated protease RseP (regulator of RpoE activity)